MRWMLIGLLVSLAVLLVAVGAVAWHIHVKHAELRALAAMNADSNPDSERSASKNAPES